MIYLSMSSSHPPFLSHTHLRFTATASLRRRRKEKVVVVMGATGTGKSRLSVDLATHFPAEIVNSDKIQIHRGLDVTTNKISLSDRRSVPHHLLGDIDPTSHLTPSHFRALAAQSISDIASRRHLPLLVGGSNSFVLAAVSDRFDPVPAGFRFDCRFLWVDVSREVLSEYLDRRVDDMLGSGMFEELAGFFDSPEVESRIGVGIGKAIGVPEFGAYFRKYPPGRYGRSRPEGGCDRVRAGAYEEAVRRVKENTAVLVRTQMGKIGRLREAGWEMERIDATEAVRANLRGGRWSEIWEEQVVGPSVDVVRRFVEE